MALFLLPQELEEVREERKVTIPFSCWKETVVSSVSFAPQETEKKTCNTGNGGRAFHNHNINHKQNIKMQSFVAQHTKRITVPKGLHIQGKDCHQGLLKRLHVPAIAL